MRQRYSWIRAGYNQSFDHFERPVALDSFDYGRWYGRLAEGQPVYGLTREAALAQRERLESRGVRAFFVAPIIVHGGFWAAWPSPDCRTERRWTDSERAILTGAASSIGSAIVRREAETARETYAAQLEETNSLIENDRIRTEKILQGIADGVIVVDLESRVVRVNAVALHLLGVRSLVEPGAPLESLFVNCPRSRATSERILHGESFRRLSVSVTHPTPRALDLSCATYLNEESEPAGRVFVVRDTTREREIERMKNQFVSSVSHELRHPPDQHQGLHHHAHSGPRHARQDAQTSFSRSFSARRSGWAT